MCFFGKLTSVFLCFQVPQITPELQNLSAQLQQAQFLQQLAAAASAAAGGTPQTPSSPPQAATPQIMLASPQPAATAQASAASPAQTGGIQLIQVGKGILNN